MEATRFAMIFLLSASFWGCSRSQPVDDIAAPSAQCRIVEEVNHDGWRTCGEISIFSEGQYSWKIFHIWSTPETSEEFAGKIPNDLYQCLLASKESFEGKDGVPTYTLYIDDSKTRHPAGVEDLQTYLHTTHIARDR